MSQGRDSVKRKILAMVQRRDGEFYWYQIERFLNVGGPEESGPFSVEIDALVNEGYIELRPNPSIDSHDRYWLTEKARLALSAGDDA